MKIQHSGIELSYWCVYPGRDQGIAEIPQTAETAVSERKK